MRSPENKCKPCIVLASEALCISQVWLPGLYVGRIAVGMHHAAALAEPLDQRSVPPQVRPADPLLGSLCPCTQQSVMKLPLTTSQQMGACCGANSQMSRNVYGCKHSEKAWC